ncbi:MAG: FUSC family protein, partial [Actinomycetospora chiangmaiensis]|nr:FUSC family protein [Actinomycetospora chiangmaiensis]
STPEGYRPGGSLTEGGSLDRWTRYVGPLRQNFTLASPNLRHALRASAVAAPALAATLTYAGAFTHWLVMTVVLTMQPFYAATWQRALERIGGTVLGGLIAVASCLVLWPIWEPDQVRQELRRALTAHAGFAEAVLRLGPGAEREAAILATTRAAGLALNDLEAALSRALQQPRAGHHPEVEAALVADATLRRISARLTVLRHAPEAADPEAETWRDWITATLAALGADRPLPERPGLDRGQSFIRLISQVDLLVGTLRPAEIRRGTAADGRDRIRDSAASGVS